MAKGNKRPRRRQRAKRLVFLYGKAKARRFSRTRDYEALRWKRYSEIAGGFGENGPLIKPWSHIPLEMMPDYDDISPDIYKWCRSNCRGHFRPAFYTIAEPYDDGSVQRSSLIMYTIMVFDIERDAALFKLWWC